MSNIAKKENNGKAISHKEDNATLSAYFREVLPEYDEERVYASDIKKILNWYNMLQERGLVTDDAPAAVGNEESVTEEVAVEAKPKKAKAKKE
jgi:hypothetical protein